MGFPHICFFFFILSCLLGLFAYLFFSYSLFCLGFSWYFFFFSYSFFWFKIFLIFLFSNLFSYSGFSFFNAVFWLWIPLTPRIFFSGPWWCFFQWWYFFSLTFQFISNWDFCIVSAFLIYWFHIIFQWLKSIKF